MGDTTNDDKELEARLRTIDLKDNSEISSWTNKIAAAAKGVRNTGKYNFEE